MWSVDANVPLFGVKFASLFTVCLIIFLILVPFNLTLLFTRQLSRFSVITRFKPLLDAYQGPYKDNKYFWVGLQLVLRATFFAISSLDRNISLTISIILISLIEGIRGGLRPFKSKIKNQHVQIFNVHILGLSVIALYNHDTASTTTVNVMVGLAAIHFSLIMIHHMFTYVLSGATRNKVDLWICSVTECFTKLLGISKAQQIELHNVNSRIPEAVNYHEYHEPLLLLGND